MTKKQNNLTEGKHRNRGVICHCTGFKCYAHYGGIPSGNILHCVGVICLPFIVAGFFSIQKTLN